MHGEGVTVRRYGFLHLGSYISNRLLKIRQQQCVAILLDFFEENILCCSAHYKRFEKVFMMNILCI